jgi:hypothetical protein
MFMRGMTMQNSLMPLATLALGALALAGCTTTTTTAPNGVTTTTTTPPSIMSVVGTPFLIAFKIPVCIASVVIAAPIAGASALTPPAPDKIALRDDLERGTEANCGPPYVVTP